MMRQFCRTRKSRPDGIFGNDRCVNSSHPATSPPERPISGQLWTELSSQSGPSGSWARTTISDPPSDPAGHCAPGSQICSGMVPLAELEPARCFHHLILSQARLPIPPQGQFLRMVLSENRQPSPLEPGTSFSDRRPSAGIIARRGSGSTAAKSHMRHALACYRRYPTAGRMPETRLFMERFDE